MSENLLVVQRLYEAFRGKDYEVFMELCSPDLEWIQNEGFPGGATWRGAQAVIDGVFRAFDDRWERWSYDIEEFIDGGTKVIVVGSYQGKHRVTGRTFKSPAVHLYEVEGGKVRRFRQFTDTKVIWDALTPG